MAYIYLLLNAEDNLWSKLDDHLLGSQQQIMHARDFQALVETLFGSGRLKIEVLDVLLDKVKKSEPAFQDIVQMYSFLTHVKSRNLTSSKMETLVEDFGKIIVDKNGELTT